MLGMSRNVCITRTQQEGMKFFNNEGRASRSERDVLKKQNTTQVARSCFIIKQLNLLNDIAVLEVFLPKNSYH